MIGQRTPYSPDEEESIWTSLGWNSDGPSALMQQISTNGCDNKGYKRGLLFSRIGVYALV
jgi:hypothetical protein